MEFNSDSDKIVLEGPPAEVQQAKESFESFTEDLVTLLLQSSSMYTIPSLCSVHVHVYVYIHMYINV